MRSLTCIQTRRNGSRDGFRFLFLSLGNKRHRGASYPFVSFVSVDGELAVILKVIDIGDRDRERESGVVAD